MAIDYFERADEKQRKKSVRLNSIDEHTIKERERERNGNRENDIGIKRNKMKETIQQFQMKKSKNIVSF